MQKKITLKERLSRFRKKLSSMYTIATLSMFLCIICQSSNLIAQTITLSAKNISMTEVFEKMKKQTGYSVFGDTKLMEKAKPVTISVKNIAINDFLNQVFKDQPFGYRIGNKTVFLIDKGADATPRSNQQRSSQSDLLTLRGKVTDAEGKPLAGASVLVRNKPQSATTNELGTFTITISNQDVLLISYIGYITQQIPYNSGMTNNASLTVQLVSAINNVDEVNVTVNTGYQSIARERIAGAISKPDMEIYNDRVGTMNVIQRLDGLIPGLTVNNAPNADPFQIRGLTTVGSTVNIGGFGVSTTSRSPLFVVDGVPYDDISLINPNDVLEVNVLKDATAASIWGSRAANGVIVISTKNGKKGNGKLKVQYSNFVRLQSRPDLDYLPVLDSKRFIQAAKETFDAKIVNWTSINNNTTPIVAPHELALYNLSRNLITQQESDRLLDSMSLLDNRRQISNNFYRNSVVQNHAISASGGTDNYAFYGSFNYTGSKGINNRPDNSSDIFKLNLRQDFKFGKRVSLYLVTDATNNISKSKPWANFDSRFTPYQLFNDNLGNPIDLSWRQLTDELRQKTEESGKIDLSYVPLNEPGFGYTNINGLAIRLNTGLKIDVYKGLSFEGTYSYTKGKTESKQFEDQKAFEVRKEVLSYALQNPNTRSVNYMFPINGGRLRQVNTSREDYTARNQLVYNKNFNGRQHQLTVLAGNEIQSLNTDLVNQLTRGFDDNLNTVQMIDYKTLSSGTLSGALYPTTGGFAFYSPDTYSIQNLDTRLISFYSTLTYTLLEKYGLNASWRIDKSNLFGQDKSAQNKPVYSIGGVWNLQKESFMRDISWLNSLRLRATYGITGNSPSPGTASSRDILLARVPSGFTVSQGNIFTINSPANRQLTWELTKNTNFGLDFGLVNNRISGSVDAYWKNTEDLLDMMLVNPFAAAGATTILGNAGSLKNRGIELSLTTINIKTANFQWRTVLNGAYNTNKVTKSYNSNSITTGARKVSERTVQGFSAYALFAYDYMGLDELGDPLIKLNDGSTTKTPNVSKPDDIRYMGTTQPKWSGGFNNNFRYNNWSLQLNMVFNAGHVMRRDVNSRYSTVNSFQNNFHADFADRWKAPGDEKNTDIPSFVGNTSLNSSRRSTFYYMLGHTNVIDASFIKIRDITLSYNLPQNLLKKVLINDLRIFGQIGNIMFWKANKFGIDPEFQGLGSFGGTRTLRTGQQTISFGANLSF
ncbi:MULTISPECIES: SusC/RagA family TonB-linked outer membrane protein [Sphingobacterium]|uniref:SusC/RagA family TonB-linked outer membrane protein n=1 Tax=Sphingobacterium TaxID=28453 RepID=UPI0010443234|nr:MULTISPECIES: SusC/RagA family TonB-linked outer membrane protein [Sphingobacterium]MCW2263102.1 TonB-linked SusC/RagA family outer membrane protein [Sphingobacterium kitahiroshimense]TCR11914.1 TonB-linked SusC/RagA family outer membrane protein [Sphingobacterium sp. JUb78]